jgi:hypothetical protein
VLAGAVLEPGQVGSCSEPQLVSGRPETIGRGGDQIRGVHPDLTLRPRLTTAKVAGKRHTRQKRIWVAVIENTAGEFRG